MFKRVDTRKKALHSESGKFSQKGERLIIYQFLPRIFTNTNTTNLPWGSLEQNGSGKLNDLTPCLLESLKEMGINTLWITGVIEHATKTDFSSHGIPADNPNIIKGEAGSVYAVKDYYDIDPALAVNIENRREEFKEAVDRIHEAGMKVIIDFVPNHTARRYHSDCAPEGVEDFGAHDDPTMFFSPSNNYYYITNQRFSPGFPLDKEGEEYIEFPAKATGNDCFSAFCSENDWYETVKINYGKDYGDGSEHFEPVPDTWNKMLSILKYWAEMGVDGFRCDMVFMVPLPFWHWAITQIKHYYPHIIFIGEIYDVSQYRPFIDYGRFDYLYDKVNLYDTLVGIEKSDYSAAKLTECWQTVDGVGDRMLNFIENHDEVRFASPSFAGDAKKVLPYLVVSSMISKGPFMVYYGQELGEPALDNEGFAGMNHRTSIFDYWTVDKIARWYDNGKCHLEKLTTEERTLRNTFAKVLNLCNKISAIREGNFFDLMYSNLWNQEFDPHHLFAWLRYDDNETFLLVANFGNKLINAGIKIPELAFVMASIKERRIRTRDLLSGRDLEVEVSKTTPLKLEIQPYSAVIIKIR